MVYVKMILWLLLLLALNLMWLSIQLPAGIEEKVIIFLLVLIGSIYAYEWYREEKKGKVKE